MLIIRFHFPPVSFSQVWVSSSGGGPGGMWSWVLHTIPFGSSYFAVILGNDFQASVAGLVWIISKVCSSPETHACVPPLSPLSVAWPNSECPAWEAKRGDHNPKVPRPQTVSGPQVFMAKEKLRAHVISIVLLPPVPETTNFVFSFLKLLSSSPRAGKL